MMYKNFSIFVYLVLLHTENSDLCFRNVVAMHLECSDTCATEYCDPKRKALSEYSKRVCVVGKLIRVRLCSCNLTSSIADVVPIMGDFLSGPFLPIFFNFCHLSLERESTVSKANTCHQTRTYIGH